MLYSRDGDGSADGLLVYGVVGGSVVGEGRGSGRGRGGFRVVVTFVRLVIRYWR